MKKDNFLLMKYQQQIFNELSNEDAGKLIKGIFNYVNSGDSGLDGYLKIIFISIKTDIDKNEKKYEETCERNKQNGVLGGRPKKEEKNPVGFEKTQNNPSVISETQGNPKNPIRHNHIHIHNHNHNLNIIKDIINYLNNKTKSKFKYTSTTNQNKINARLNEGYTLDDFIVVIDKKYDDWNGTEFEQYLCPETLFGTKFEKYLNQKISKNKKNITTKWLDKKVDKKVASSQEVKEMNEMLSDFK